MSEISSIPEHQSLALPNEMVTDAVGTPVHAEEFASELPIVDEKKMGVDLDGYVSPTGTPAPHECPHEVAKAYLNMDVEIERMMHDGLDTTTELGE